MDMYQKRKIRKEKRENSNQNEKFHKVVLNWYPGHMAKTKRQIIEDLKLIDIVVEILDARIPISSQNPDIGKLIQGKQRIVVLNKSDLASDTENKNWVQYFENKGIPAVIVDSNSGKGIGEAIRKIETVYQKSENKFTNKGRVGKSIRVMILGIPNVGKSSFINRITKKNSALVGNKPGVTRQKQWVRINNNIELLDTPGVLWPKFESEEVGLHLAYTGTIKDDVIEIIEVGFKLLNYLLNYHKINLIERYKLEKEMIEEILNQPESEKNENDKTLEIMEKIGEKRGTIVSGGKIDLEKVARIIIDDFRSGKLGKITIELAQ